MPSEAAAEQAYVKRDRPAPGRWPMGVSLTLGACASAAIWGLIALGLRAALG